MRQVVTWDQQRQRQRQCIVDAGMLSSYPLQISAIATTVPISVPSEVTVLQLQAMVHERIQRHKESFAVILERCYGRIRRCAGINLMQCTFKVPPFVSGLPLYNFDDCKSYVVNHLIKNGFSIQHNGTDEIVNISWMPVGTGTAAAAAAAAGAFTGFSHSHAHSHGSHDSTRNRLVHAAGGSGGGYSAPPAVRSISDFRPVSFRM